MSRRLPPGPGLARCDASRPFARRTLSLLRCADELWSEWLQHVDLVSEGRTEPEGSALVYRGSTSLIVLTDRHGGSLPHDGLEQALYVAARDPHLWLRLVRIARREAASRSPGPLDSMHCQSRLGPDPRGLRIEFDVEACVISSTRVVKTKHGSTPV